MAQREGLVIKSGIPTLLGSDTPRADRSSDGGFTTAGLSSGDLCQLSGALTLIKAVNSSPAPVVGVYDGVSGALVKEGVVVANFAVGPTVAGEAVYLSATPGQLTNVKPTSFYVHEVGVTVEVGTRKVLLQPRPVLSLPSGALVWRQTVAPAGITNLNGAAIAYHIARKLVVVYTNYVVTPSATLTYDPTTDTWTNLSQTTPGGHADATHGMCYAPTSQKVYLWGGGPADRTLWAWDGVWSNVGFGGPTNSWTTKLAYDSTHDRVIIFSTNSGTVYEWNPVAASWAGPYNGGTPPGGSGYMGSQMAYMPSIDKTVFLAGYENYTYLYDQPTHSWSRVAVYVDAGRQYSGMFFDTLRGVVTAVSGGPPYERRCWSFNGALWTRINDYAGAAGLVVPGCCWASDYNTAIIGSGSNSSGEPLISAQEGTW